MLIIIEQRRKALVRRWLVGDWLGVVGGHSVGLSVGGSNDLVGSMQKGSGPK